MLPTVPLPDASRGYEKTTVPRVCPRSGDLLAIEETRWCPVPETREEHSRLLARLTEGLDDTRVSVASVPSLSGLGWRPIYNLRVSGSRAPLPEEIAAHAVTRAAA